MPDDQRDILVDLIREFRQVEAIRQNWEQLWADLARNLHPNANVFARALQGVSQAERRTEYIFDSCPPQALESFASVMETMLFPRPVKWHTLVPVDPKMKEDREVRMFCEDSRDVLFKLRYSPRANFAAQAHECMKDLGAFGTTSLFTDERIDEDGPGFQYRSVPLQDLYFAQNNAGLIDRVFRKFLWSAQNAYDEWGDKCPPQILATLNNQRHREFEFLHVVRPRKAPEFGRKDYRGMPLESWYICLSPQAMIEEGGYQTNPYATSRYTLRPREVYGAPPGLLALSDAKMLYEMSRTDIMASQLIAQPAILIADNDSKPFNLRPGALNYDMVSPEGRPLALPFNGGAQPEITEEKMQKRRDAIDKAFLSGPTSIMRMIEAHPEMTATAISQWAAERGTLLTPAMGRQQSEFLGVLIRREFNIAWHAGLLPDPPDQLVNPRNGKLLIGIEYSSELNRLQRAGETTAIMTTLQQLAPLAAAGHPEVFDPIDFAGVSRELWEASGAPSKLLLSPEQVAEIQQQKAQQAQIQGLVAAAPQLAAAAKDAADAHATAVAQPAGAVQ